MKIKKESKPRGLSLHDLTDEQWGILEERVRIQIVQDLMMFLYWVKWGNVTQQHPDGNRRERRTRLAKARKNK